MTARQSFVFMVGATIVLGVVTFVVAVTASTPFGGFRDPGTMLAIITAIAVGIERTVEAFWTVMGLTRSSWWPLGVVTEQVNGMVSNINAMLVPFLNQTQAAVDRMARENKITQEDAQVARRDIAAVMATFQARSAQLRKLAPDNQQVQLVVTSALQSVNYLQGKYSQYEPGLVNAANLTTQAINSVSDFVSSLTENPARRLISLYAGALIGTIVAGMLGLDLLQAVLQPTSRVAGAPAPHPAYPSFLPHLGVALTGLVMGLGSNPTHEVIRAVQEYKKTLKSANSSTSDGSGS